MLSIVLMGMMLVIQSGCKMRGGEQRRYLPESGYVAPVYFEIEGELTRQVPEEYNVDWEVYLFSDRWPSEGFLEWRQWYSWDRREHWFLGNMLELGEIDQVEDQYVGRYLGISPLWYGCIMLWVNRGREVKEPRRLVEIYDEEIGEETEVVYSTIPEEAFRETFPEFGGEYHYIEPRAIVLSPREKKEEGQGVSEYWRVIRLRLGVIDIIEGGVELVGCEVGWGDDLVEGER